MRFSPRWTLSLLLLLGCTAPVEEKEKDSGPDLADACPERCRPGEVLCEAEEGCPECVFLESDENHCGACGQPCADAPDSRGWTCNQGECSCTTSGEPGLCDGTPTSTCCNDREGTQCFDLTTSIDHCGRCSNPCTYDPSPAANNVADHCEDSVCVCGDFGEACDGSLSSACCMDDAEGTNARCANKLTDEGDCGECGSICAAPEGDRCRNGQCVCGPGTPEKPAITCPEGQECCGTGKTAVCVDTGSCG